MRLFSRTSPKPDAPGYVPPKFHTHLAPARKLRRMNETEVRELLEKAQAEFRAGEIKYGDKLLSDVIEAMR